VAPVAAVSDTTSYKSQVRSHTLMPVFLFSGNGDTNYGLHRIYVYSDKDCVNLVYKGAIVGGPAYAPRTNGPLALPPDTTALVAAANEFLGNGDEGKTFADDTTVIKTTEATQAADSGSSSSDQASVGNHKVDLWDRSGPSGRYYWTVVPVQAVIIPSDTGGDIPINSDGSFVNDDPSQIDGSIEYHDTVLPQDACHQGHVLEFGKQSVNPKPVDTRSVPYATGLAPTGRLLSAAARETQFYGPPLVSWDAAPAAVAYDVEWSRTSYPWHRAGRLTTHSTSAVLPLAPGRWWYRVRGIDDALPGSQAMSWSSPVPIRIAAPKFAVVGG